MAETTIQTSGPAAVTIAAGTAEAALSSAFDPDFRQRLCVIGALVAIAVLNETGGTASRTDYARQFIANPSLVVTNSLAFAVVADGVTTNTSADQAVANRIGSLWSTLATGY